MRVSASGGPHGRPIRWATRDMRRCGGAADPGLSTWPGGRPNRLPDAGEAPVATHEILRSEGDRALRIFGGVTEYVHREPVLGEQSADAIGRRRRDDEAESDTHVEGAEHLLVGDTAESLDQSEDRRRLRPAFDVEPDGARRANQVEETIAGDVSERMDGQAGVENRQHGLDVDSRRSEKLVGQRTAQLGHACVERQPTLLEQRAAGQGETVRVQPGALESEQEISGLDVGAGQHTIERNGTDRGADQVETVSRTDAANHLPYLRELPAGAAHPGQLTADGDAPAEWTEQTRIGFLDRDVVDQGGGPGTNAEDVVDVHGDAVDAHTVVAARGLRDEKLRPDAVRGDGDAERLAHRNHVGEVSNIEDWTRAGGKVKGRTDPAQECAQTAADRPYPDRVLGQRRHRSHPYRRVIAGSVGHRRRRLSILLAHPRRERRSIAGQVETVQAGSCPLAIPGWDPGISIRLRAALEAR